MTSQEIVVFIEHEIAAGNSLDQTKTFALAKGWSKEDVNGAAALYSLRHGPLAYTSVRSTVGPSRKFVRGTHVAALIPVIIIFGSLSAVAYGYYNNVVLPQQKTTRPPTVAVAHKPVQTTQTTIPTYIAPVLVEAVATPAPTEQPITHLASGSPSPSNTDQPLLSNPVPAAAEVPVPVIPPIEPVVPTVAPVADHSPSPIHAVTPIVTVVPPLPVGTPPPAPVVPPVVIPPVVVPPVVVPPAYPVYPGCQSPDSTYARTIYIDPALGSETTGDGSAARPYHTLAEAFAEKKIHPGDHVILLPGDHGKAGADGKYGDTSLPNSTAWIWIDFKSGATAHSIDLRYVNHVLVTNAVLEDSGATQYKYLFSNNDGANIILADSTIRGTKDSSGWTANDWINGPSGARSTNNVCNAYVRNSFLNVRFGIVIGTTATTTEGSRMKTLMRDNVIHNFSADGMQPNASDMLVLNNKMYDEYVSIADGDGNHDDGMQLFALGGVQYDNVDIENNWVQETTNPNRSFNASLQGISQFDGIVTNMVVKNNVVLVSAYHGISLFGAVNSIIANNTLVNTSTNGRKLFIGTITAGNTFIKNNIDINGSLLTATSVSSTNNYFDNVDPATVFTTFDINAATYDVHVKPGSVIDGKGVGAFPIGPVAINSPLPASGKSGSDSYVTPLLASAQTSISQTEGFFASLWHAITSWFFGY